MSFLSALADATHKLAKKKPNHVPTTRPMINIVSSSDKSPEGLRDYFHLPIAYTDIVQLTEPIFVPLNIYIPPGDVLERLDEFGTSQAMPPGVDKAACLLGVAINIEGKFGIFTLP